MRAIFTRPAKQDDLFFFQLPGQVVNLGGKPGIGLKLAVDFIAAMLDGGMIALEGVADPGEGHISQLTA